MSSLASQRLSHAQAPISRGIHHLALNTEDMKATIDFYVRVLGMPLVHALRVPPGVGVGPGNRGNPPFENLRHYFFDMGGDSLLAFFEMPKGAKQQGDRDALGAMQHVSFCVTEERFRGIVHRLQDQKVPMIGPANVGSGTHSIYFYDPNGIRLEFSYQELDASDVQVVARWTQTQAEVLEELRTLTTDAKWLSEMTSHLPSHRAA